MTDYLTDDDIAYCAEVNRKCAEMTIELQVIRESVERHGVELDALTERANKVFAQIDELFAAQGWKDVRKYEELQGV